MAILSRVQHPLGGADNVSALELIRGDTREFNYDLENPDGTPQDLTPAHVITVTTEWYRASVEGSEFSRMALDPSIAGAGARAIRPASGSRFTLFIPPDFCTTASPANQTQNVIVGAVYVTVSDGASNPFIRTNRWLVVVRHKA